MKQNKISEIKLTICQDTGETPLADAVKKYSDEKRVSFHMPGHKGSGKALNPLNRISPEILRSDLTELPGLDDLHHSTGVIAKAQQLAAEVFGAEDTFFLVNGTTSGIVAAIAAVASEEDTIVLERHSHECTTRGLIMSGAAPCYVYNDVDPLNGLPSGISCEAVAAALERCHSPAAVLLTHPSYYGTYSDIRAITETAHQAGAVVIVDEAHGAQLLFTRQQEIPSSLDAGADIVVQSTHKMLGSLTQSSMLHVQGTRVDREKLQYYISFMNTTSPSYLLMSSLDLTRAFLSEHGRSVWQNLIKMVSETKKQLNQLNGVHCLSGFIGSDGKKHELEGSRLMISAWEHGLTGMELGQILASDYGVDVEFSVLQFALILAGAGSTLKDFEQLVEAVTEIVKRPAKPINDQILQQLEQYREVHRFRSAAGMIPRQAVGSRTLRLRGLHAEGMVSARDISLYPPGIPVIRTGEIFTREILSYIETAHRNGLEFHGTAGVGEDRELRFLCAEDPRVLDMMNGFY